MAQNQIILQIALDTPADHVFDYLWFNEEVPQLGQLALVSFGRREMVGLIVGIKSDSAIPANKLKPVISIRNQLVPVSPEWIQLCRFGAEYYQRMLGEVALPAIPKNCRAVKTTALDKALKNIAAQSAEQKPAAASYSPVLNAEQRQALHHIVTTSGFSVSMLFGVTGSGKTEVYLQAAAQFLSRDSNAQILLLVPEINLTPQLHGHLRARFPDCSIAVLHSGMSEGERSKQWLMAHTGKARIILGTRLAVLASLPTLKFIVIDEEHDLSYKQQEGLRYSARDLAIWRARQLNIPIVLGSATPSLETWQHTISARYTKLCLPNRAVDLAVLPKIRLIDLAKDKAQDGLSSSLITALKLRLEKGEQSLLYLNRRGYAPVLTCEACGWISNCTRCSAFLVVHKNKSNNKLRCHHCSFELRVPAACPTCGNPDIQAMGRGTQRIEESLQKIFPNARISRIDADSTRLKGSAQQAFEQVHRGEVDIVIGTQMVAKGHDFKGLTLVGAINPDNALFTHDYRAAERLFAQLMQVSGRAGRVGRDKAADGNASEVLIQTRYPQHALYQTLKTHDYPRFAHECLQERLRAGLPPFIFQALLTAESKALDVAMTFLKQAAQLVTSDKIVAHDPIPMSLMKLANMERAQLLIESPSRPALQQFLKAWMTQLRQIKPQVNWMLEVDPTDI